MSTAHRLVEVTNAGSPEFVDAFAIYQTAIPRAEQKTRDEIIAGVARTDVRFWAYTIGTDTLGISILYGSRLANTMLLEYLAISPCAQGGGLGSELFTASFEASRFDSKTSLLIEVDSEADDVSCTERGIRLKRKQFYRRLGCREVQGFDYILPLGHYGAPPRMNLLVLGGSENRIETVRLKNTVRDIYKNVYAQRDDDPRIEAMFARQGDRLALV